MLTQSRLRDLLCYDPDTGLFTWRVKRGGKATAGSIAGASDVHGYIVIRLDGVLYKAHRLAWYHTHGAWPAKNLDHINRIKSDNRIKNLRPVDQSLNMHNANRKAGESGTVGIAWDRGRRKWCARVKIDYATKFLGRFDTKAAAVKARKDAVKKILNMLEARNDTL